MAGLSNTGFQAPTKKELFLKMKELDDLEEEGRELTLYDQGMQDTLNWALGRSEEPIVEA